MADRFQTENNCQYNHDKIDVVLHDIRVDQKETISIVQKIDKRLFLIEYKSSFWGMAGAALVLLMAKIFKL
jgi:hypothetical protein